MKTNSMTINQMNRGMDVCPQAKDQAISALVMRGSRIEDAPNPAFPAPSYAAEDDNPSSFVRNLRAGRDMRMHI